MELHKQPEDLKVSSIKDNLKQRIEVKAFKPSKYTIHVQVVADSRTSVLVHMLYIPRYLLRSRPNKGGIELKKTFCSAFTTGIHRVNTKSQSIAL
jgi:hypothetical protein